MQWYLCSMRGPFDMRQYKKGVNFYFCLCTSALGYKWGYAVKFFKNMIILHKKTAFERGNSPFMLDPRPILSVNVR